MSIASEMSHFRRDRGVSRPESPDFDHDRRLSPLKSAIPDVIDVYCDRNFQISTAIEVYRDQILQISDVIDMFRD